MDDRTAGAANLIGFIEATAGRRGTAAAVRGGRVVASPVPIAHGFLNAAVATAPGFAAAEFVDDTTAFFAEQGRPFVVWVAGGQPELRAEVERRGGVLDPDRPPAMSIHRPIGAAAAGGPTRDLRVEVVADDEAGAVFGDLCERGYEIPGLAWLLAEHDSYRADGTTWAMVAEGDAPLGVACSFVGGPLDGSIDGPLDGSTGGIYYVATPPEHRGRGAAAFITAWLTDRMLEAGVGTVVLQASQLGEPVYRRLGFETYDTFQRFTFEAPTGT
jgi:N-acetylglutamate synthase